VHLLFQQPAPVGIARGRSRALVLHRS
jgi:hypothetical protein